MPPLISKCTLACLGLRLASAASSPERTKAFWSDWRYTSAGSWMLWMVSCFVQSVSCVGAYSPMNE